MKKILNRTREEWLQAIHKSIEQKQQAVEEAKAQLKAERLAMS